MRAYDDLVQNNWGSTLVDTQEALDELKSDIDAEHHPAVLYALEKVLMATDQPTTGESGKTDEELASV